MLGRTVLHTRYATGATMSLFLGALALPDDALQGQVRLGVLSGSTCAAIAGAVWLRVAAPTPESVASRAAQ